MNKFNKFYSSKSWRDLRDFKLSSDHFICQKCGGLATEVHHIISLNQDFSKCLDINNLMSLCKSCHSKITESENNKNIYKLNPAQKIWNLEDIIKKEKRSNK